MTIVTFRVIRFLIRKLSSIEDRGQTNRVLGMRGFGWDRVKRRVDRRGKLIRWGLLAREGFRGLPESGLGVLIGRLTRSLAEFGWNRGY